MPRAARRGRPRWLAPVLGLLLLGGLAVGAATVPPVREAFAGLLGTGGPRTDLIPHKVEKQLLQVTVVERGTLESADNADVACKVKAGAKGTYASTIRWVIDDGSIVTKGQLLMELDDSSLQDQFRTQSIVVDKAKADWVTAEAELTIAINQNKSDIAAATAALEIAELDLNKYTGLRADSAQLPAAAAFGGSAMVAESGEYRQTLDDVSSRLKLAEADLEAYRDRSAWSQRMVRLKYVTPSAAKVDQSNLAAALDAVAKLNAEKNILENFLHKRDATDLRSKVEVAALDLERAISQAKSKEVQAESARKTAYSVYHQELEKLKDNEQQIRETKVLSPQDGMVVYYKDSNSRYGSSSEGVIQQGAQVKEGQKMLRIPDLKNMQVGTRVHEAMVSRLRGDDRQPTGFLDATRVGLMVLPGALNKLVAVSEQAQGILRETNRDREYYEVTGDRRGQPAKIKVDAFPDRLLDGHVRSVAAVASQADWYSSDVKVYQTVVSIDEYVPGLKPDMSAEVTIQVDPPDEKVVVVPIQAVVGGAETGPTRLIYVITPEGARERKVEIGLFNDKVVEIKTGLEEGETVVLNPKVLLGDKAKTRGETDAPKQQRPSGGGGKGKGKS